MEPRKSSTRHEPLNEEEKNIVGEILTRLFPWKFSATDYCQVVNDVIDSAIEEIKERGIKREFTPVQTLKMMDYLGENRNFLGMTFPFPQNNAAA